MSSMAIRKVLLITLGILLLGEGIYLAVQVVKYRKLQVAASQKLKK